MRCQNGGVLSSAQYILMRPQNVYAIGIHHHRTLGLFQHFPYHGGGILRLPQAAANQYRIHLGQPLQNLTQGLPAQLSLPVRQRKYHRLVELHRLNGINTLRYSQENQSRTGAQGAHGCQIRRAGIAPAAAQQQNLSKIAFVPPGVPVRQQRQHLSMI